MGGGGCITLYGVAIQNDEQRRLSHGIHVVIVFCVLLVGVDERHMGVVRGGVVREYHTLIVCAQTA